MVMDTVAFLESASLSDSDALIVVDMQKDFMPGGALAVSEGDELVPGVNSLAKKFFDPQIMHRSQVLTPERTHLIPILRKKGLDRFFGLITVCKKRLAHSSTRI
ncbi:MAG: hypothetical protein ACXACI_09595 [Candidatus Hodarchaeales archaeon]|jgi:hypothetical protein